MLNSVGTAAHFLDPPSMKCGTLTAVSPGDVVVLLSKSGNSVEIIEVVPYLRSRDAHIVSMTCSSGSLLGSLSDYEVFLPLSHEVCPFNLSPLSSPTLFLLFGDMCKHYLLESRPELLLSLAHSFPNASHSTNLLLKIKDLMLPLSAMPVVNCNTECMDALSTLNNSGRGFVLVVNDAFELVGTFTDMDLRHALHSEGSCILGKTMSELTKSVSRSVMKSDSLQEALAKMDILPSVAFLPVLTREHGSVQVCGVIFRRNILAGSFIVRRDNV